MNTSKRKKIVGRDVELDKDDDRGMLLSIEMELSLLEQDLNRFETLYANQEIKNKELEYNLSFLKKNKVVASIKGYKTSIIELKKGIEISNKLSNQINKAKKQIEAKQISHEYYLRKVEVEFSEAKVLIFKGRYGK